jgi:hypothetical protein
LPERFRRRWVCGSACKIDFGAQATACKKLVNEYLSTGTPADEAVATGAGAN